MLSCGLGNLTVSNLANLRLKFSGVQSATADAKLPSNLFKGSIK